MNTPQVLLVVGLSSALVTLAFRVDGRARLWALAGAGGGLVVLLSGL